MNVIPKGSDKLVTYLSEILEQEEVISPDLIDDPKVLGFMKEILPIEQAANREYRRLLMQIASNKLNVLQLDREWKATARLNAWDLMTAREKTIKQIENNYTNLKTHKNHEHLKKSIFDFFKISSKKN